MDMRIFQDRAWSWCLEVFADRPQMSSVDERCRRFLEEAIELVQAAGLPESMAQRLVAHVYSRPVGEVRQEVGGAMVTLAALAHALFVDAGDAAVDEMRRIERPEVRERVRAKQAEKDVALAAEPSPEVCGICAKAHPLVWATHEAREGVVCGGSGLTPADSYDNEKVRANHSAPEPEVPAEVRPWLDALREVCVGPALTTAPPASLAGIRDGLKEEHLQALRLRNESYFEEEVDKLDRWSDDVKFALERELRELDIEIKAAKKASKTAVALAEKLAAQKLIKTLEQKRTTKRKQLFDAQDDVDKKRADLIDDIERQLETKTTLERVFVVRWSLQGATGADSPQSEDRS